MRHGRLSETEALQRHEALTAVRVRLLGDRVSRRLAWQLAREHGFDSTVDAEHLAVARLQADAYVTVDGAARARAEGVVPLATVDDLSA